MRQMNGNAFDLIVQIAKDKTLPEVTRNCAKRAAKAIDKILSYRRQQQVAEL